MSGEKDPADTPQGFLEIFGSWLEGFPPVPNWVNWVLVFLAVGGPILIFVWRRWGIDFLAARSAERAKIRAFALLKWIVDAQRMSLDLSRLIANCFTWLFCSVIFVGVMVVGSIVLINSYAPIVGGQDPTEKVVLARGVISWSLLFGGYMGLSLTVFNSRNVFAVAFLRPLTKELRARAIGLFAIAGMPEDQQARHLREFDESVERYNEQRRALLNDAVERET